MSISKRDFELKKPSNILVFDKEKGKATCIKMYGAKAKGSIVKVLSKCLWHRFSKI